MINNRLLNAAVFAAIVLPGTAMATNGMFMMGNGTKANGRAGVGIGLADTAISGADNPAAMVRVGNRVDFGLQIFSPDRTAEITGNSGNPLAGAGYPVPTTYDFKQDGNSDGPFYIPEMGFNYMLNDSMSIGLTVVGTSGMNTNYKSSFLFNGMSYPHDFGINVEQVRILPTIAYKINNNHSVGASLQIAYQQFHSWGIDGFTGTNSMIVPVPSPPFPAPMVPMDPQISQAPNNLSGKGRDDSFGFGYSLGWQGQFGDRFTVGLVYNSEIDMDEFDEYKGLFAENGSFDVPENYGLGLAFQATDSLLLAFDVQQINYSKVNSIGNSIQSGNNGNDMFNPANFLGTKNGSGFGWNDMTVYKLAAEYQVNKELTLRTGYSHSDQPIDKDQTMFNILAPAVIEDHFTIGMTYVLPNESEISMFYMHAFENSVNGQNSISPAFGGGEANIEMSQDAFGLAYGWNF